MPAREDILNYENRQLAKRYDQAFASLKRMVQSPHYNVTELICRLLTSRVLDRAAGAQREHGYKDSYFYGPLYRMEWVVHFVGHEILDDGEPALCWHRYSHYELDNPFEYSGNMGETVDCKREDKGAMPYWHRYHEIAPAGKEWLDADKAMWTLNWYEDYEDRRYKAHRDTFGRNEEREPEDPLMVALADELRALPKLEKARAK